MVKVPQLLGRDLDHDDGIERKEQASQQSADACRPTPSQADGMNLRREAQGPVPLCGL
jgi:hypothetical protein